MAAFVAVTIGLNAQTSAGGISPQMLQQIERGQTTAASDRAISNAIQTNSIDNLAKNSAIRAVSTPTSASRHPRRASTTRSRRGVAGCSRG